MQTTLNTATHLSEGSTIHTAAQIHLLVFLSCSFFWDWAADLRDSKVYSVSVQIFRTSRHAEILAVDTVWKTQRIQEILISKVSNDSDILAILPLKEAFCAESFVEKAIESCIMLWCADLYVEREKYAAGMLMNLPCLFWLSVHKSWAWDCAHKELQFLGFRCMTQSAHLACKIIRHVSPAVFSCCAKNWSNRGVQQGTNGGISDADNLNKCLE